MPAIITDTFKKEVIQDLFNDALDSSEANYYIAIGRSEDWDSADNPITPLRTKRDERNFRLGLQSVKSTAIVSFVVPRYNWVAGTIYSGYDDNIVGIPSNSYYVLTDNNSVYICLQQGRNATGAAVPSVNKPTSSLTTPFTLADGYTWKFLYSISGLKSRQFLTANYNPIQLQSVTDSASTAIEIEQYGVQQAAVAGSVSSVKLISGGSGYTTAPTVTIVGNGTDAKAVATISGGSVVKIDIKDSSGTFAMGSGYDYAGITITGDGSGASARAVISPANGFGSDPRVDLKATAIMYNASLSGAEGGNFITGQDFRQVALMKGLKKSNSDSDFTASTGLALSKLVLSSVSSAFSADNTILGTTSGAKALVDKYDNTNEIIYYHQSEETGFLQFVNGEVISETDGGGSGIIDSASSGDINIWSGDIHYIENRAAVERDPASTEDVKIVIQL